MKNAGNGMQTFDQDLLSLHRQQLITVQEAMHHATNPEQLQMSLRGISSGKSQQETNRGVGGLKPAPPPQRPQSVQERPRGHE
jgi:Tfp pilus assembly ATPase PilU